jgi:hypothetical protein
VTAKRISDVAFGAELPSFDPDSGLVNVRRFA